MILMRSRLPIVLWLVLALVAAWAGPVLAAERRVALVIGVGAYRNAPVLRNTLNDARGMAAALQKLDFDVDTVLDPDRAGFEAAIRRFGTRAEQADLALLFYSGHALEYGGRNWLLPVSARLQTGRDLPFEAADLDLVLDQLEGRSKLSVIILDACRDNPFRLRLGGTGRGVAGGGLARVQAAAGTLVAFSTAPGSVAADGTGPNSPFTTALLAHIATAGLEIRQLFAEVRRDVRGATGGRQIPWEESAMEGALYLKPAAEPPPVTVGPNADVVFWDSVRASNDPAELRAYLAHFPNGLFAELARSRLEAPKVSAGGVPSRMDPPDLTARLLAVMEAVPQTTRDHDARQYAAAPGAKAIALSPDQRGTWRSEGWDTDAKAELITLEGCQVFYGRPCELLARNDEVLIKTGESPRATADMTRVRYGGMFDPAQIPVLPNSLRSAKVVTGYADLASPKAMAFHPWGRVFISDAAAADGAAEAQALAACNGDTGRHGQDGPCFLYAVDNQVVLPLRLSRPVDSAYIRIAVAGMSVSPAGYAPAYAELRDKKALAIHVETGRVFYWDGLETQAQAEQLSLEGCQQQYGSPCVLLASGAMLVASDLRKAIVTDMPRLHYHGPYRTDQVPFLPPRPDLQAYPALSGPKAIAIRPYRAQVSIVSGAPSLAEAERRALADCNADHAIWPCFVYASADQVVLPDQRTEARQ